jgi:hypothetical protein
MPPTSKVDLFAAIRRDSRAGLSVRSLARKYQVSRRLVAWCSDGDRTSEHGAVLSDTNRHAGRTRRHAKVVPRGSGSNETPGPADTQPRPRGRISTRGYGE